jgi:hypothetical protein
MRERYERAVGITHYLLVEIVMYPKAAKSAYKWLESQVA